MILRTLHIGRFGTLEDRRFELGSGVWILEGPNEAGKTSLQLAARALLYGFGARSAAGHPHGGEGARLLVAGLVGTALGDVEVERALEDRPTVRIAAAGGPSGEARRDDGPLAGIEPATAAAFDQLHRLSPDDQLAFGADPGPELDRILMGDGMHGASVRALIAQLDSERATLWRNDRRSRKTRALQLDRELAEVAAASREARAVEAALVELEVRASELGRRREEVAQELRDLEGQRQALALCARIAVAASGMRETGGVELDAFGDELPEAPGPLLAALEDAEEAAAAPRERLAREEVPSAVLDASLIERAGEIEAAARSSVERARLVARAGDGQDEAAVLRQQAEDLVRSVTGGMRDDVETGVLEELEAALAQGVSTMPSRLTHNNASKAASLGVGVLGAAASAGTGAWWPASIAALVAPALLLMDHRSSEEPSAPPFDEVERAARRAGLDARWTRTREGCAAAAERLRRAADLYGRAARRTEAARLATEQARALEESWERLARALGVELAEPSAAPEVLGLALGEARRRHLAWTRDRAERDAAEAALARAEDQLGVIGARFEEVTEALRRAVPGERTVDRAHERLIEAVKQRQEARGVLRQLLAEPALGELADSAVLEKAREGDFDANLLRRVELQLDGLRAEEARLGEELARGDERLRRERPARTPSELDSARGALLEERDEVHRRHDELALAAALLREGERRHRARFQSGILERASRLLTAITGGRHGELRYREPVPEAGGSGRSPGAASGLSVHDAARGTRVPVAAPLSRGTREQVHLCLRLAAVVDRADRGGVAPLLLDEAFAHWDEERRGAAAAALADFAAEHGVQVLLFTCHGFLAEELARATGGRRVSI